MQLNPNLISQYDSVSVTNTGAKTQNNISVDNSEEAKEVLDFEELNTIFQEEGINALLAKLSELNAKGIIDTINIKSEDNGKTTISFKNNGISYEFTGTKSDKVVPPQETSSTTGNSSVPAGNSSNTTSATMTVPSTTVTNQSSQNSGSIQDRLKNLDIKMGGGKYKGYKNPQRDVQAIFNAISKLYYNLDENGNIINESYKEGITFNGQHFDNSIDYSFKGVYQAVPELIRKTLGEDVLKMFYSQNKDGEWARKDSINVAGASCRYINGDEILMEELCKEFAVELFGQEIVDICFTKDENGDYILKEGSVLDGYEVNSLWWLAMYVQTDGLGDQAVHANSANKPCAAAPSQANNVSSSAKAFGVNIDSSSNSVPANADSYSESASSTNAFMRSATLEDFNYIDSCTDNSQLKGWYIGYTYVDENGNEKQAFRPATLNDKWCKSWFHFETDMSKWDDTTRLEGNRTEPSCYYVNADSQDVTVGNVTIEIPLEFNHSTYWCDTPGDSWSYSPESIAGRNKSMFSDGLKSDMQVLKNQFKSQLGGTMSDSEFDKIFNECLDDLCEKVKTGYYERISIEQAIKTMVDAIQSKIENGDE